MKKILSILLAVAMIATLGLFAFAVDGEGTTETPTPTDHVTINKIYKTSQDGIVSPAETFNFVIKGEGVRDAVSGTTVPEFANGGKFTISYEEGKANVSGTDDAAKSENVTLPTYTTVGVYTYKVTETAGNTAGVTYDNNTLYFDVTVLQGKSGLETYVSAPYTDDGKGIPFVNTYSASSLEVSKTVTGNAGQRDRYFNINVNFTGADACTTNWNLVTVSGGSNEDNPTAITEAGLYTFQLKHGETVTFANLPYGVTYEVTEDDYEADGYDEADIQFLDSAKTINTVAADTVNVVNNKEVGVSTGVVLGSASALAALALAGVGSAVVLGKKNEVED